MPIYRYAKGDGLPIVGLFGVVNSDLGSVDFVDITGVTSGLFSDIGNKPIATVGFQECDGILIAFKDVDNKYQTEVAEMLNRNHWGWVVDMGADWKDWTFDVRYMNQFKSEHYTRIADEIRYISIGLTVGYRF